MTKNEYLSNKTRSLSLSLTLVSPSFFPSLPIVRFITWSSNKKKVVMKKAEIQIPVDEHGDRWSAETAPIE